MRETQNIFTDADSKTDTKTDRNRQKESKYLFWAVDVARFFFLLFIYQHKKNNDKKKSWAE